MGYQKSGDIANGTSIENITFSQLILFQLGEHFNPLDLSDPNGPYTITASITIPNDPDISNNVSTSLDIGINTPTNPTLTK